MTTVFLNVDLRQLDEVNHSCPCECVQDVIEKQEFVWNFQEVSITTTTCQGPSVRNFLSGGSGRSSLLDYSAARKYFKDTKEKYHVCTISSCFFDKNYSEQMV